MAQVCQKRLVDSGPVAIKAEAAQEQLQETPLLLEAAEKLPPEKPPQKRLPPKGPDSGAACSQADVVKSESL